MSTFLQVPKGKYIIGSTLEQVRKCAREWRNRLINPNYTETEFFKWIYKEFPQYQIEVNAFELSQTLVTNMEAMEFVEATNSSIPESLSEPINHPVWGVSRKWAEEYCGWLGSKDPLYNYRLPTEAEWEIAARGGDEREYSYGNKFDPSSANTIESGIGKTTPVDYYRQSPGPYGHFDLAGNVEEWVASNYYVYPQGIPIVDDLYERLGPNYPILRGGSFCCGGDLSRSARRHGPFPDPKFRYTGFRLVRFNK